ncbi:MAG: DinB family protein [Chloroflexota bacterium]|nr:DinB family protein [Chloroflexota bacterium]
MNLGLKYVVGADGAKTLTIPDDRRAQAVSYVRDGAVKTPKEIGAIVQEGHDGITHALAGLSEPQAQYKPSPEDWCVLELMAHVVTTKQIFATLCRNLGEGHLPPGFGPQFEEEAVQDGVTFTRFATLGEARTASQAAHDDLLAFIRGLDASTNVEVTFKHFVFGAFNSREWAVFQRIHDGDHTPQIDAIKASTGFPAA